MKRLWTGMAIAGLALVSFAPANAGIFFDFTTTGVPPSIAGTGGVSVDFINGAGAGLNADSALGVDIVLGNNQLKLAAAGSSGDIPLQVGGPPPERASLTWVVDLKNTSAVQNGPQIGPTISFDIATDFVALGVANGSAAGEQRYLSVNAPAGAGLVVFGTPNSSQGSLFSPLNILLGVADGYSYYLVRLQSTFPQAPDSSLSGVPGTYSATIRAEAVPEPGSGALVLGALVSVTLLAARKSNRK